MKKKIIDAAPGAAASNEMSLAAARTGVTDRYIVEFEADSDDPERGYHVVADTEATVETGHELARVTWGEGLSYSGAGDVAKLIAAALNSYQDIHAAAPELLSACEAAFQLATIQTNRPGKHGTLAYRVSEKCRKAIEKAKGEKP